MLFYGVNLETGQSAVFKIKDLKVYYDLSFPTSYSVNIKCMNQQVGKTLSFDIFDEDNNLIKGIEIIKEDNSSNLKKKSDIPIIGGEKEFLEQIGSKDYCISLRDLYVKNSEKAF